MATPSTGSGATMGSRAAIVHAFDGFRAELDEHNDRRERLIKASRDITILSKKTIFLLHRLAAEDAAAAGCGAAGDDAAADARAQSPPSLAAAGAQGRAQLAGVQALFRGMRADLAGARFWRYQGAVSPGLQEYIEALAFAHYLERGALVSRAEVQASLSDADGAFFPVSLEEYLLGVSDLTGELMRFAITAISRRGGRTKAREVSDFVRDCKAGACRGFAFGVFAEAKCVVDLKLHFLFALSWGAQTLTGSRRT
ncbi:Translin [Phellopilus nigrolimitatus]|nr:Translin [Phellopilus nigrolimitatus]